MHAMFSDDVYYLHVLPCCIRQGKVDGSHCFCQEMMMVILGVMLGEAKWCGATWPRFFCSLVLLGHHVVQ